MTLSLQRIRIENWLEQESKQGVWIVQISWTYSSMEGSLFWHLTFTHFIYRNINFVWVTLFPSLIVLGTTQTEENDVWKKIVKWKYPERNMSNFQPLVCCLWLLVLEESWRTQKESIQQTHKLHAEWSQARIEPRTPLIASHSITK